MSDQYAVFGNPIEHSKSPIIHQHFAEQTAQDIVYGKQLVELEQFDATVKKFVAEGGKGLNITVPFKEQAYALVDSLSQRAKKAGAINTFIVANDGCLHGDNTDGIGIVRDIKDNHGWPIKDKHILVLGAGGAVRGVLGPLLAEQPASVIIANRTVEKAEQLAELFKDDGNIQACGFAELNEQNFDLVINGTSASLSGSVPPISPQLITAQSHCYDMMYSQTLTPFLQWAKEQGCEQLADGLGMLVEQAAEAFYLWRGVRPDTASVIDYLSKA